VNAAPSPIRIEHYTFPLTRLSSAEIANKGNHH
jgi:hypothetical protein